MFNTCPTQKEINDYLSWHDDLTEEEAEFKIIIESASNIIWRSTMIDNDLKEVLYFILERLK